LRSGKTLRLSQAGDAPDFADTVRAALIRDTNSV
jgi:hypothetical protein